MQVLEEESLRDGVLQLVGVALYIDGVEAGNGREIIDPADKAITQLRLNGVAYVGAEEALKRGHFEIPDQHRRPQFEAGLQVGAIDGPVSLHGCRAAGNLAFCVVGFSRSYFGAECPAVEVEGQREVRVKIKAPQGSCLITRLTA